MLSKKDRTSSVRARALYTVARRFPQSILGLVCVASLSLSLTGCPGLPGTALWVENLLTAPTAVTSIMPDSGPTDGGTEVTIRGVSFETDTGVLFGEYAALNVEYVNEGLMRATTPLQGAGIVPIVLIAPDGRELTTESSFAYLAAEAPTQPAAPAIVTIEPDRGPVGGGTPVTIVGSGFGTDAGVLFGDAAPVEFTVVNDSLIMAITPAHEVGIVDVAVFSSGGRTDVVVGGFAFVTPDQVALVVDAVTPSSGPSDGGTMVMIEGSGFVVGTAVFFGSSAASDITVVNDGVITATTPPHAEGDVLVELRAPDNREATADQLFTYYFGRDSDGDGLSDIQETEGWDIWVDYFGIGLGVDTYGNFPGLYSVTSDPDNPDTDGDGLSDHEEYLIISDPRKIDTDEDGLLDAEEANRWLTSPISVDTDGDCRGPTGELVPNTNLFDGAELKIDFANDPTHTPAIDATSPTLDDTDGDGRTDHDEFDHSMRSAVISDLPVLELQIVDDIDVRLDIEYAEEQGQTTEYGHSISEGSEQTHSQSNANTWGVSVGVSAMFGYEGATGFPCCNDAKWKTEVTASVEASYSHEWTLGWETAESFQEENSRMEGKSLTHTETAASGSITTGITLTNTGPVSYHLSNLGMTVRLFERAIDLDDPLFAGSYKTLATLVPTLGDGVTLAPGQSTPVLQIEAQDVNADRIKDFMRAPHMLHVEEAYFDLETEDGVNYAFMEEVTQSCTATIQLDFGDGESYRHRFATNVSRLPDGSYTGVRMADALELLGIEFRTAMQYDDSDPNNPVPTQQVLTQIRKADGVWLPDVADPNDIDRFEFWLTTGSSDDFDDAGLGFEDIVLQAGDSVFLVLARDDDEDGLYSWDEDQYGTSDDPNDPNAPPEDYDSDGLTDLEEASTRQVEDDACDEPPCFVHAGWDVRIQGHNSYHVFSDPRAADADADGLNDLEEMLGADGLAPDDPNDASDATDPNKKDTDGDTLPDDTDPLPLMPAARLFVKLDGTSTDGLSWETAYTSLRDALEDASQRNGNALVTDDVFEIWVADGTYIFGSTAYIQDCSSFGVYGGFSGDETKRAQRNVDPTTNGTMITAGAGLTAAVIGVSGAIDFVLDGFTLSGGASDVRMMSMDHLTNPVSATLRNLVFEGNNTVDGSYGAALILTGTVSDYCPITIENCVFADNSSTGANLCRGGAIYATFARLLIKDCEFVDNRAVMAGGAIATSYSDVTIDSSRFSGNGLNQPWLLEVAMGGAIFHEGGTLRMQNCRLTGNFAHIEVSVLGGAAIGGAISDVASNALILTNCLIWNNGISGSTFAANRGNAIFTSSNNAWFTNCTIACNRGERSSICLEGSGRTIQNCIIALNEYLAPLGQVESLFWSPELTRTCIYGSNEFQGDEDVINVDPGFADSDWVTSGDLHLGSDSPLVDWGNSYVDTDPVTPGLQYLPATDLDGDERLVDGDDDGEAQVDLGVYECQGSDFGG